MTKSARGNDTAENQVSGVMCTGFTSAKYFIFRSRSRWKRIEYADFNFTRILQYLSTAELLSARFILEISLDRILMTSSTSWSSGNRASILERLAKISLGEVELGSLILERLTRVSLGEVELGSPELCSGLEFCSGGWDLGMELCFGRLEFGVELSFGQLGGGGDGDKMIMRPGDSLSDTL